MKETHNNSAHRDSPTRCLRNGLWAARSFKRVCQAWYLTRQVQVLIPGIRRAEG